jgi:membrane protease YdiL (CAAX protease family)
VAKLKNLPPGRFWLALAPALVVPLLGALVYFLWLPGGLPAQLFYGGTKLFTLLWPLLALRLLLRQPWPRLGNGRRRRALPLGLLSGLLMGAAFVLALQTPLAQVAAAGAPAIEAKLAALGIAGHYWSFALLLSFVHSGLEEYYWRWFVFGRLAQRLPVLAAHLLAALAFAAHHVVVVGVLFGWIWGLLGGLAVMAGGLIWSGLYQRQGTLAGAWLSHAVVDLVLMGIGYWLIS